MLFDPQKWVMPEIPEVEPENEPWRRLLKDAIGVIQKRGWTQNKIEAQDGSVCLLGALQVARHGMTSAKARYRGSDNRYSKEDHYKARLALKRVIGDSSIASWNDRSGPSFFFEGSINRSQYRTKDEVIAALKKAAAS